MIRSLLINIVVKTVVLIVFNFKHYSINTTKKKFSRSRYVAVALAYNINPNKILQIQCATSEYKYTIENFMHLTSIQTSNFY